MSEGREAAGTDTASGWTGEKKIKAHSVPSSEDLVMIARDDAEDSSGNIVHGQEQGSEQIEGLDWDMEKLLKEIDCCLLRLRDGGRDDNDDNDVLLALCDEQHLTDLNQRLALCRIRAREVTLLLLFTRALTCLLRFVFDLPFVLGC